MPGLRPRKTRWLLLAVSALMAAGATYLGVLESNQRARVRTQPSSHVAPSESTHEPAEELSTGEGPRAALRETSSAPPPAITPQ